MTYPRFSNKIITAGVPSGIFKPFLTISNEQIINVLRQFSRIAIMAYLIFCCRYVRNIGKNSFFAVVCAVPVDQSLIFCLVFFYLFLLFLLVTITLSVRLQIMASDLLFKLLIFSSVDSLTLLSSVAIH